MRFNRFLISMLLLTLITQYFTQTEVKAYSPYYQSHYLGLTHKQLEKISYWTDYFFALVRPEMRGKKIELSQTIYRREKAAIRRVIRQVLLCSCYSEGKTLESSAKDNCEIRENNYFFNGFYHDLTDAIFYARHPEITRRQSKLTDLTLFGEWGFIRQYFLDFDSSQMLREEFIPVCTSSISSNLQFA